MIAVDTNLLVYAHREDSSWHRRAYEVIKHLAEGRAAWAIPHAVLHEFLAIVTHPRIYSPPTPLRRALEQVNAWLESPSLVLLSETGGYWSALERVVQTARASGAQVHDARIVALCLSHGASELWSADRDFSRYPFKVVNPLLG